MWPRSLGTAARSAGLSLGTGPVAHGRTVAGRRMGTHWRNEPREPLNSRKGAKEFIYRLQPEERGCLLRELQAFQSRAIAQGEVRGRGYFRVLEQQLEIPEIFEFPCYVFKVWKVSCGEDTNCGCVRRTRQNRSHDIGKDLKKTTPIPKVKGHMH